MPEFSQPFGGVRLDKKMNKEELIRAIRFLVAAEYEAVQMYTQLAESIDDKLAQKVLLEVADEEKVHAGEFLQLLIILSPEEEKFYQEGYKEDQEKMD